MTDTIERRGLRALGRHGVLEEEKARAQPFEVDLDLEVDLQAAGRSDDLNDTVDYGAVTDAVRAVIEGEHCDLLEHLADRIARAATTAAATPAAAATTAPAAATTPAPAARATASPTVTAVTVTLRKLRPPVAADLASAGVRIHRRREDLD